MANPVEITNGVAVAAGIADAEENEDPNALARLNTEAQGGAMATSLFSMANPFAAGAAVIAPGMAVNAEIITGDRRVIDFVLSPILRYRHESGRER
jgi:hypothetical protein